MLITYVVKETLFCICLLGMKLWCLHFFLVPVKMGFMSCHFIWLFSINFSSIVTVRLLIGLTMLVTFICENNPKGVSILKVKL